MFDKEKLQDFFGFLKNNRQRQLNFFLSFFVFCLLPVRDNYADLNIDIQRPVVRQLEFDLPEVSQYPVNFTGQSVPYLTAFSALVIDVPSKTIMMEKNPDNRLLPASTTKIMTALVSLDYYSLDQVLKVEKINGIGRTMGLEKGEEITAENLLYGILVQSGNDAAHTLAENYPGGVEKFVEAMNLKAKFLHLNNTHFINPAGIDSAYQFSTVHDLAILTAEALKYPVFAKMVATKEIKVSDVSGEIEHSLDNINELLGKVMGLKGVKTGWTESAGECLVAYTEREGKEIITVVLASQDRFGETEKLIDWAFTNHQWE